MFSSTQILIGILGLALAAGVGCSDSDDADGAGGSGAVGGAAGAGGSGAVGGAAGAGGSGAVGGAGGAAGSGCEVGAGGAAGAGGATGAAGATGAGGATGTAITQDIPAACLDELTGALADFPINVTIETSAISANMPFTADITARITVTEAFIEAALAFSPTLTTARVSLALATVAVVANATGPEVQTSLSPPQTFDLIADTNWNCIPGPLVIPLSTETGSYTAGASGTNIEFDLVGFLEVGSPTQFPLFLFGTFPIHIDCVPGTVNDNGTPDDDADDFVNPQDPAARISFAIP